MRVNSLRDYATEQRIFSREPGIGSAVSTGPGNLARNRSRASKSLSVHVPGCRNAGVAEGRLVRAALRSASEQPVWSSEAPRGSNASSAIRVNSAPRSAGVCSTIARMPSRRGLRITRQAISPRVAIKRLAKMAGPRRQVIAGDGWEKSHFRALPGIALAVRGQPAAPRRSRRARGAWIIGRVWEQADICPEFCTPLSDDLIDVVRAVRISRGLPGL
jgi:hypothetical protein